MAVDLSTVDTLPAALTYHRERHLAMVATTGVATSFVDSALPGSEGNVASLDGERPKIDAGRADRSPRTSRATPREATPEVVQERFTAMEVPVLAPSAEHTWMNLAASMLAHAQTTPGSGRVPYRRGVMMQPVEAPGVQGTPRALVIGSRP